MRIASDTFGRNATSATSAKANRSRGRDSLPGLQRPDRQGNRGETGCQPVYRERSLAGYLLEVGLPHSDRGLLQVAAEASRLRRLPVRFPRAAPVLAHPAARPKNRDALRCPRTGDYERRGKDSGSRDRCPIGHPRKESITPIFPGQVTHLAPNGRAQDPKKRHFNFTLD
jgi:hypothetical protein